LSSSPACSPESPSQSCARAADSHHGVELGVAGEALRGQRDDPVQPFGEVFALVGLAALAALLPGPERELLRQVLDLHHFPLGLLGGGQDAELRGFALQRLEGPDAAPLGLGLFLRLAGQGPEAVADPGDGRVQGIGRRDRPFEQGEVGQGIIVPLEPHRPLQLRRHEAQEFPLGGQEGGVAGVVHHDRDGHDLPLREVDGLSGLGMSDLDVSLEPADDEIPVRRAPDLAAAVGQRAVEQLEQGREAPVVAVMGRGREQDQGIGRPGQDQGQLAALAGLAPVVVLGRALAIVVGLVQHHQVVAGPLQPVEDAILFEVVHRGQRHRQVVEGIGPQLGPLADALQLGPVGHDQAQAEPLGHLCLPLLQERPGRGDDEDAAGSTACDQLRDDQAGLDRLAQADVVGQQQARARHPQASGDRHKLVGLDPQPTRLDGDQRRRAEGLLQKERLVVDQPVGQLRRAGRVDLMRDRPDLLERGQDVNLAAGKRPAGPPEPEQRLLAHRGRGDHLPAQAAQLDLGPRENLIGQRQDSSWSRDATGPVNASCQTDRSHPPADD